MWGMTFSRIKAASASAMEIAATSALKASFTEETVFEVSRGDAMRNSCNLLFQFYLGEGSSAHMQKPTLATF
jgi:hypothetical protein